MIYLIGMKGGAFLIVKVCDLHPFGCSAFMLDHTHKHDL